MATLNLTEAITLPDDGFAGALAARVWLPEVNGPSVVAVREDGVFDISAAFATMRDLCESPSPAEALRAAEGPRIGALKDILGSHPARQPQPLARRACSRPSTCRRSRRPASPSRNRCSSG